MIKLRLLIIVCLIMWPLALKAEGLDGSVRWEGNIRRLPQVARIAHDVACPGGLHPIVERRRRSLAGIAVWLVSVARANERYDVIPRPAGGPAEILFDESRCLFAPRIAFVSPGAEVRVTNIDPRRHWLLVEGRHVKRRQSYHPSGAAGVRFVVAREDRVRLWSGLHRWMDAWVVAVDTSWHAITDSKGRFTFSDVPPGEYVLHTWHPQLGEETSLVTVPAKKPLVIGYRNIVDPSDPDLKLSIPRMRKEWVRSRGDFVYGAPQERHPDESRDP